MINSRNSTNITLCSQASPKQGSIVIGVLLLTFSVVLTGGEYSSDSNSVILLSFQSVLASFLAGNTLTPPSLWMLLTGQGFPCWTGKIISLDIHRIRSRCLEEDYVGNCTKREWVASKVDNNNISDTLVEIGPVWKNEFISLFSFLPWYLITCYTHNIYQ